MKIGEKAFFIVSTSTTERSLKIGDKVVKVGGDYTFDGIIVAVFFKLDAISIRYVVEDDRGVLHIFSSKNLTLKN